MLSFLMAPNSDLYRTNRDSSLLENFCADYEECRTSWKVCLETEFLIIMRLVTRLRSTMLAFLDVRMSFTCETWFNKPTFLFVRHTQIHSCVNRNSKWSTRSPIVYFYVNKVNKLYLVSSESSYCDYTRKPSSMSERIWDFVQRPDRLWVQTNLYIYEHSKPFIRG